MGGFSFLNPLKTLPSPGVQWFRGRDNDNPSADRKAQQQLYDNNSIFGLGAPGEVKFYDPAYKNLMDLINNPGQTDNRLFQMSLGDNARSTDQRMASSMGGFSRAGLGNSGLAAAFQQAIAGAGSKQRAKLTAEDARRREDLRRDDTQLLYQFIQQPRLNRYSADKGVAAANDAARSQSRAQQAGAAAALIGTLAAAFACHAADELYGFGSDEAMLSRYYMAKYASPETFDTYNYDTSLRLAERIKVDPSLRAEVKPIFDGFVAHAKKDFKRFQ